MTEIDTSSERQAKKYSKYNRNTFSIVGHNGAALVEPVLTDLGWVKTPDKHGDDFRFKWTELLSHINYDRFKEGEQLVNHIPNCGLITNKLGLLTSLRTYDRSQKETNKGRHLDMDAFVPETYVIDDPKEREHFFEVFREGEIWINKPTGLNQGKGISLIRDIDNFRKELLERDYATRASMTGVKARIVQRYLSNPLLIQGKKFDIRSYMYIASTSPYVVLYCPGYIRLSMNKYSNEDTDLITHLTNQYIQKKSPNYGDVKEDTIWSMDKFNEYLNDEYKGSTEYIQDWAKGTLDKQMQQIMQYVFNSVKYKMANRVGFFEIYGFDFMVDANFKTWLIEVNVNPALHINCTLLKEILPPMIEEVILLALECFEKCMKPKKSILPLENAKLFTVIYSESISLSKNRISAYSSLKSWIPPRYQSHSISPNRCKGDDKVTIDTRSSGLTYSKAIPTRVTTLSNAVSSSKDIKVDPGLRAHHKKTYDSGTKSEKVLKTRYQSPVHVRSRSYNVQPYERSDSRLNTHSNYERHSVRPLPADRPSVHQNPNVLKNRLSVNLSTESPNGGSRHNRVSNGSRKLQSIKAGEVAKNAVDQSVNGLQPLEGGGGKAKEVIMSKISMLKEQKVFDRSS